MNNQIRIFESEDFGKIRVVDIDGLPWWILKDVGDALGLTDTSRLAERLDSDELTRVRIVSGGQNRRMYAINESGLYAVILRSDKPKAKDFRRWITHEVLPSIRKHGAYISDAVLEEMAHSREFTENLLSVLQAERLKKAALVERLERITPKAHYCDVILQSTDAVQASILAKDYGMSTVAFNKLLNGLRVQFKVGNTWVLYKKHADKGYTVTRTYHVNEHTAAIHTYWTQRGRLFLYDFLKWHGIIPEAEKVQNKMIGGSAHIDK